MGGCAFQSVGRGNPYGVLERKNSVWAWQTFGVDQFSLGTTEPFKREISLVNRAVKSASGSSSSYLSAPAS